MAAALTRFNERGFINTTPDDLAAHIGVSKPFIYAHFRSKGELLAVICAQGIATSMLERHLDSSHSALHTHQYQKIRKH